MTSAVVAGDITKWHSALIEYIYPTSLADKVDIKGICVNCRRNELFLLDNLLCGEFMVK